MSKSITMHPETVNICELCGAYIQLAGCTAAPKAQICSQCERRLPADAKRLQLQEVALRGVPYS